MIPKQIIIIGGGYSINTGINLGLKEKLSDQFVITANYSFLHFPHTLLTFTDYNFYHKSPDYTDKDNPDIYEELKKEPLIIGYDNHETRKHLLPNTYLVKGSGNYHSIECFKKDFTRLYCAGFFSLNIAMWLINFNGEIFLLGFDFGLDKITHYYSDIVHRGIGFNGYYKKHKPNEKFNPFLQEKNIKIYNVIGEPESRIECFEKINYQTFYCKLNNCLITQEEIRKKIIKKITDIV